MIQTVRGQEVGTRAAAAGPCTDQPVEGHPTQRGIFDCLTPLLVQVQVSRSTGLLTCGEAGGSSVTACARQLTCLLVDAGGRSVLDGDAASPVRTVNRLPV